MLNRKDSIDLHKGQRVSVPVYSFCGVIKQIVLTRRGRSIGIAVDGAPAGSALAWVNAHEVELIGIVCVSPLCAGRAA